jgi:integrase
MYPDGGNLYLRVEQGAHGPTKSWLFRYAIHGRERLMGLGALHQFSLSEARDRARAARQLLADGIDPIDAKRARKAEAKLAALQALTFKQAAIEYIKAHDAGWRSERHRRQWADTLEQFAYPLIGNLPVGVINIELVLQVLKPHWQSKTETMSRVRGRIEAILDFAKARGLRDGDNPASWRTLKHLLPARSKVQWIEHLAAVPYQEIGAFMAELRKLDGIAARALEFVVLTAARTGEVRMAEWSEINGGELWTIPAARTKAHREHRVPLCKRALEIVEEMRELRTGCPYIFPGQDLHKPLGVVAVRQTLRRLHPTATVHGFRSSFRDWCGSMTNFPREVAELALAHRIGNAAEQAYSRADLFEKRRKLMEQWCRYCSTPSREGGVITPLRAVS